MSEIVKGPELELIERLGEMSKEEIIAKFFNEEKLRCADSSDEELAIRLKGIRLMQIVLKAREHGVDAIDRERAEKRTAKEKENRKELDKKWSPEPRETTARLPKQETLLERIEREKIETAKIEEEKAKKLSLALDISLDEARQIIAEKKRKAQGK